MRRILNALKARLFGQKPEVERRSAKTASIEPAAGDCIVYHHLKMKVTATRSRELWKWLHKHGWRVANFQNDRRHYTLLPENTYEKLDLASTSDRAVTIRALLRQN